MLSYEVKRKEPMIFKALPSLHDFILSRLRIDALGWELLPWRKEDQIY